MKEKIIDNLSFVIGVITVLLVCIFVKDLKLVGLIAGGGSTLLGICYLLKKDTYGYLFFSVGISLFSAISLYHFEIFDKFKAITFILCCSLALLMGITIIFTYLNNKKAFAKYSVVVEGEVVDLIKNPNTTKEYYQPVYQYEVNNEVYLVNFPGYKNMFIPKIGDKLKIYVDPNDYMNVYFDKTVLEKVYTYGLCLFLTVASVVIIISLFL